MPIKSKKKNFTALSNEKQKKGAHYREDFLLNLLLSFSILYTTLSKKDKCNNLLVATFYASKEEQNPRIFFIGKKLHFYCFWRFFFESHAQNEENGAKKKLFNYAFTVSR